MPHIRLIEALAANAWPAPVVEPLAGWRLRFNWGETGRANSVWPNASGGAIPIEAKLARVEACYAARGLPAKYQIWPAADPSNLDTILAERG